MVALEAASGLAHGGEIQRIGMVQDVAPEERRKDAATIDGVAVGFGLGVPARVKLQRNLLGVADTNRGRKQGVQGVRQFFWCETGLGLEIGDLALGMNTGIGAAGGL